MFFNRVGSTSHQGTRVRAADNPPLREGFLRLAALMDAALNSSPGNQAGPLLQRLHRDPDSNLLQLYQSLNFQQQQRLRQNLGAGTLREILSLSEESDHRILNSDTLHLARRLEQSSSPTRQGLALQLYSSLGTLETPLGREARAQAQAMAGGGEWGRRLEFHGNNFFHQVADPALLGGLVAASTVAKLTYASVFTRLAPAGRAMSWGRLWATRGTAGLFSLGAEVPSWVLAENGLRTAMGGTVDWSGAALRRQGLSALVMLGMLRGSGVLGRSLSGAPLVGSRTMNQILMPQATMMGGVYTALSLEESLGIRENQGASHRLFDAITFMVQAQTAGKLSHTLMGRPWAQFQNQLDYQIRTVEAPTLRPQWGGIPSLWNSGLEPAWAGARVAGSRGRIRVETPSPEQGHYVLSKSLETNGSPASGGGRPLRPQVIAERLDQMIRPKFGPKHFEESSPPKENGRPEIQKVGVLTSGGDGPGENAALEALVKGAIDTYGWSITGIREGYRGLLEPEGRIMELDWGDVHGPKAVRRAREILYGDASPPRHREQQNRIQFLGGNLLRSSRTNPIETDASGSTNANRVKAMMAEYGIDALVVIGGNGSQRAAKELSDLGVPLAFIPQSIDADVPGSAVSLGFPSAVNRGALEIHEFLNTAQSCHRWFLVEVMGQHYGLLTLGIARSAAQGSNGYYREGWDQPPVRIGGVFTEIPRSLSDIPEIIRNSAEQGRRHGVVLVSEGVEFQEGRPGREEDSHHRLLIEAGDVTRWLRKKLIEVPYGLTNTRSVSLGYSLRGARPVRSDLFLAKYFAQGALGLIHNGNFGRMVGADFIGRSAKMTFVYPKLSEVIGDRVRLRGDYFEFMRRTLEE